MEIWDLYDTNRQPLNKTHVRGIPMVPGEYHTVVAVWTVNSKNEILLTLRHPNKQKCPNLWENTCGSVLAGESSTAGAVRELKEETGITITENDLILLGTKKEASAFVDTYLIYKDAMIEDLTMQEDETSEAQWVTLEKLDQMVGADLFAPPVVGRLIALRKEFESHLTNHTLR